MQRHGYRADSLIEVFTAAQGFFGRLSKPMLRQIARGLQLPFRRVQGTASFYHLFRFTPRAQLSCLVCTRTACHVRGSAWVFPKPRSKHWIKNASPYRSESLSATQTKTGSRWWHGLMPRCTQQNERAAIGSLRQLLPKENTYAGDAHVGIHPAHFKMLPCVRLTRQRIHNRPLYTNLNRDRSLHSKTGHARTHIEDVSTHKERVPLGCHKADRNKSIRVKPKQVSRQQSKSYGIGESNI